MSFAHGFHLFLFSTHIPAGYWWIDFIRVVVRALMSMFGILLTVPPLIWLERRLLGFMQQRLGPNRVGPWGLFQPLADALKLLRKEDIIPNNVDRTLYVVAPILMLMPTLVTAGVIPWGPSQLWGAAAPNVNVGILYALAWSSLGVYGVVLAGWSSNNKYSLLGGLRSSAQMISYELGMGLAIVTVVLITGSLGTSDIVQHQANQFWGTAWMVHEGIGFPKWHIFRLFPMGFVAGAIYIISMVAETNRAPFDLPEAETELVAGYHTEYTSMKFAMFFMAEYGNMVVVSAIAVTLFFGGWSVFPVLEHLPPFMVNLYHSWGRFGDGLTDVVNSIIPTVWFMAKVFCFLWSFIWIRATLPRLRYDMLMNFGWKGILPIALGNILCVAFAIVYGYFVGLAIWIVLGVVVLVVTAGTTSSKKFTAKTRLQNTLRLTNVAEPFVTTAHAGYGRQTLPPDASSELTSSQPAGDLDSEKYATSDAVRN
jgi:NADH-quinone oxidoreductase subunit H